MVFMVALLFCSAALAADLKVTPASGTSESPTSDNIAFEGIMVTTDGTNSVTVDIFSGVTEGNAVDGWANRLIPESTLVPGASSPWYWEPSQPIACPTGIYVSVKGASTKNWVVYYR